MAAPARLTGGAMMGLAATLLAGCSGGVGVTIPHGWDELEDCAPIAMSLDELEDMGEPGCDLEGSSVQLSDSRSAAVAGVGSVASFTAVQGQSEEEFVIVNWGVPGVGVYRVGGDADVEIWATTPEAAELQRAQAVADGHAP